MKCSAFIGIKSDLRTKLKQELNADAEHIEKSLRANAEGAELLHREVSSLGIRVVPTWANFLFCDLREDAAPVCEHLQEDGIIVRPLNGSWGAPQA